MRLENSQISNNIIVIASSNPKAAAIKHPIVQNILSSPSSDLCKVYFTGRNSVDTSSARTITKEAELLFANQGYDFIGTTEVFNTLGATSEEVYIGIKQNPKDDDFFQRAKVTNKAKKSLSIAEYFDKETQTPIILVNKRGQIIGVCNLMIYHSSIFKDSEIIKGGKSLKIDLVANLSNPKSFEPSKYVDIAFLKKYKSLFSNTEYKLVSTQLIKIAQKLSNKLGYGGKLELLAEAQKRIGYKKLGFQEYQINPQHMYISTPLQTPNTKKWGKYLKEPSLLI